jgi:hypothetical protein
MVRLSARGVTLVELMFVCGMFAVVLTVLAMSLRQTVASHKQLDEGSEVLVSLELTRLKVSNLLVRSELMGPVEVGVPDSQLPLRLFELKASGQPMLDAQGIPVVGEAATLAIEEDGKLVVRGETTQSLLARLGEGATFEATRVSESRILFRVTAGYSPEVGMKQSRELVFVAGF